MSKKHQSDSNRQMAHDGLSSENLKAFARADGMSSANLKARLAQAHTTGTNEAALSVKEIPAKGVKKQS